MILVLAAHLIIGIASMLWGSRAGRRIFLIAAVAPLTSVVWASTKIAGVLDGESVRETMQWVPELGITVDLRLDGFALLMLALVSGVGLLVFVYANWYFGHGVESAGKLAGTLVVFSGAMLGLVLADNLLWLFVCWELTSITSYLLIGHQDRDAEARSAALQALLITGMGGLAMLGGFVLLGTSQGTFRISELVADPTSGGLVTAAAVLVLLGAFTKSAQVPFHGWLPGAMVASTPISAYLHSAAMVKAGIFLVLRLGPAFDEVTTWRTLAVLIGLATMFVGGLRALRQNDLKLLLAFGTVSQLGLLMTLAGLGHPSAVIAACALLLAHAAFKAALFMVVGIIDHQAHTRDLRLLGGFGRGWRPTMIVATISAASMAGILPFAGFIAKEAALESVVHGGPLTQVALVGIVLGSVLTVAYSIRFVWGAFASKPPTEVGPNLGSSAAAPSIWFVVPAVVLTVVTVWFGLLTGFYSELVDSASRSLDPVAGADLKLWHGLNLPLALSVVAIIGGAAVFAGRRVLDPWQERLRSPWSVAGGFDASVRALSSVSGRITSVAQPGSLPIYVGIILLTAVAVPGVALITIGVWPGWPKWLGSSADLAVAAMLLVGATAAVTAKRRFVAAIFLGLVGYGMTLLFVVQGAPDLALTQFAIETLTVVLFLLVLRFLPDRFEHRASGFSRVFRIGVSAAVGVFVLAVIVIASAARTEPSVSQTMIEQSVPQAGGRNVVNVILVDFRGYDTLGEITVLLVAGIGAVTLARVGRGRPSDPQSPKSESKRPKSTRRKSKKSGQVFV